MNADTDISFCAQPFSQVLRRAIINLINEADDQMERESRIQIALDYGAIDYPTAYELRCGDL